MARHRGGPACLPVRSLPCGCGGPGPAGAATVPCVVPHGRRGWPWLAGPEVPRGTSRRRAAGASGCRNRWAETGGSTRYDRPVRGCCAAGRTRRPSVTFHVDHPLLRGQHGCCRSPAHGAAVPWTKTPTCDADQPLEHGVGPAHPNGASEATASFHVEHPPAEGQHDCGCSPSHGDDVPWANTTTSGAARARLRAVAPNAAGEAGVTFHVEHPSPWRACSPCSTWNTAESPGRPSEEFHVEPGPRWTGPVRPVAPRPNQRTPIHGRRSKVAGPPRTSRGQVRSCTRPVRLEPGQDI